MKSLLTGLSLIALILIASLPTGCKTPVAGPLFTTNLVHDIVQLAAYGTAEGLIKSDPSKITQLTQARDGFCQLAAANNFDIATFAAIAGSHGLDFLSSSEGTVAITGAMLLTDLITGNTLDLKNSAYAQAIIEGACSGLTMAVAQPAARPLVAGAGSTSVADPTLIKLTQQVHTSRGH